MHAAALRALGLPHTYEAVRTSEAELPSRIAELRAGVFAGLNVTVPHKTRVLALVDAVDPSAAQAGAANTLVRGADGRVVAHNTDVAALRAELAGLRGESEVPGSRSPSRALVLGSGGAARAAVLALDGLTGGDVFARARRPGSRFTFRPDLPCWQPWAPDAGSEAETAIVVQATSAGMVGAEAGDAVAEVVAWDALPLDAVALDVVYAPETTPFLVAARRRGLRTAGGLGMLARQGALALALWTGAPAPLSVMLAALRTAGRA
jgi:shikimate dehydrogenase